MKSHKDKRYVNICVVNVVLSKLRGVSDYLLKTFSKTQVCFKGNNAFTDVLGFPSFTFPYNKIKVKLSNIDGQSPVRSFHCVYFYSNF